MDMKSISQQLQNDIRDILEGKIKHPNQQKIDVHEPEKDEITAKDFEMLRKGKKAVKEDAEVNEAEAKKPNPFDWKNNPSMLNKKPGEKAGFDSKKISTGTVYSKKPVKESYTFAEYLDAARQQHGDEEAVNIANEAFKNQDITLFIDQSQSPEA
jgi:hypothetical protein